MGACHNPQLNEISYYGTKKWLTEVKFQRKGKMT